jgi:hypothetical protein
VLADAVVHAVKAAGSRCHGQPGLPLALLGPNRRAAHRRPAVRAPTSASQ